MRTLYRKFIEWIHQHQLVTTTLIEHHLPMYVQCVNCREIYDVCNNNMCPTCYATHIVTF